MREGKGVSLGVKRRTEEKGKGRRGDRKKTKEEKESEGKVIGNT